MYCNSFLLLLMIPFFLGCSDDEASSLSVSPEKVDLPMEGGEVNVKVNIGEEVRVTTPGWVTQKSVQGDTYVFAVSRNLTGNERNGKIVFATAIARKETIVNQQGGEVYKPIKDTEGVEPTVMYVQPIGGKSDLDQRSNHKVDWLWDRDFSGTYKSQYEDNHPQEFPAHLDFYFDESLNFVEFIRYHAANEEMGAFGDVQVLVSKEPNFSGDDDSEQWEEIAHVDLGMRNGGSYRINVDKKVEGVRTVRLKINTAAQNEVFAREIEVYTKNPNAFDPTVLFADGTCSELKAGITKQEIEAYPYEFFKNMARHMMNDTYRRDFRIDEYKAYQSARVEAKLNKTSTYSELDNPTGIVMKKGETLVAMCEEGGRNISLRVVDWDREKEQEDGYGKYVEYMLEPGLNSFENCPKGLVYVMYNTEDFRTVKPVKIHIASGSINGYYDSSKHQPNQWKELLSGAVDKHFDVMGKYAHLLFPAEDFAKTSDGPALLQFYDNLVYEEQRFMGLEKYERMFNNRMLFSVMYTSYMYSAGYHTAYNKSTMKDLCDLEKITASNWGPAHEVGHSNQTRPGLNWMGMGECTNNIMALHIQRITNGQSRLIKDKKYEKAFLSMFNERPAYIKLGYQPGNTDVFQQLIVYWQLELYLHYALGITDFYADVYEMVRQDPNDKNKNTQSGEIQLDFVLKCCKAAKLDLTDFFDFWGFFREVTLYMEEYGSKGDYKVTAEYAREIKQLIADLGYPKPKHAFQFITEPGIEAYKNGAAIVKGTATKTRIDENGTSVTSFALSGWKNVVLYKVYSGSKLLYVTIPENSFSVKDLPHSIVLKAVDIEGKEHTVTLK